MANEIQYLSQNGSGLSVRAALIDPEPGSTCGFIWDGSSLVDIANLAGTSWRITLANKSSTSLYYGDRPSGIAVTKRLIVLVWESATPAITDQFDGSGEIAPQAESGVSQATAIQRIAAITAGKISGAGSGTETFLGLDGSTTRVVATVDGSGNRSAMTYS